MPLDLTSPEFEDGDVLPDKYQYEGENINPAFSITDVPEDTESMVLVCEDLDAEAGVFVHWMLWNIPPDTRRIFEDEIPEDAVEGYNDHGTIGYSGPKSDARDHRFQFHLYALDTDLELDEDITRQKLEKEIAGHILDEVTLTAVSLE